MTGGQLKSTEQGTPQGGVISPLLANVYLDYLDRIWRRFAGRVGRAVRYADNSVVLCRSKRQAQQAYRLLEQILERLDLRLNDQKTQIVNLHQGKEGVDFLGFHCRLRESHRWRGKWYLHQWPGKKAMNTVRARVRALTRACPI